MCLCVLFHLPPVTAPRPRSRRRRPLHLLCCLRPHGLGFVCRSTRPCDICMDSLSSSLRDHISQKMLFLFVIFFASWLMKMTYDYALDILLFDFKRLGVSASLCLSCNSSATSVLLLPHVGSSDNFLINFVFILKKASCSNTARITLSR